MTAFRGVNRHSPKLASAAKPDVLFDGWSFVRRSEDRTRLVIPGSTQSREAHCAASDRRTSRHFENRRSDSMVQRTHAALAGWVCADVERRAKLERPLAV